MWAVIVHLHEQCKGDLPFTKEVILIEVNPAKILEDQRDLATCVFIRVVNSC